jgi:hypothetical protein
VCFSASLPTTPISFLRSGPQRGKIISVVDYTTEKLSALLATMQKMFELKYLHEFETILEFTLGFQSGAYADVYTKRS